MSTTSLKRSYAHALADAEAFRAMFPADSYERWEFAGSLRRNKPDVADVEHVIIPRFEVRSTPGDGLFAETVTESVNLVWFRLEALLADKTITQHVYGVDSSTGKPRHRWGPLYRGADFCGFNHEIFSAGPDNWGSVLAIRTGPADFSQWLVTRLRSKGRRNDKGKVWRCEPCPDLGTTAHGMLCGHCQGTNLKPVEVIPVPDEATYFELCGVAFVKPADRKERF